MANHKKMNLDWMRQLPAQPGVNLTVDDILFLDTETNGLEPVDGGLLSIGWSKAKGYATHGHRGSVLLMDGRPTDESIRINGITSELLQRKGVLPEEAFETLRERMADSKVIGFFNAPFDVGFLMHATKGAFQEWALGLYVLDVQAIARKPWCMGAWEGRYSLNSLARLRGVGVQGNTHDAADDAELTMLVFQSLPATVRSFVLNGVVNPEEIISSMEDWRIAVDTIAGVELVREATKDNYDSARWEVTVKEATRNGTKIPDYFQVPEEWKTKTVYQTKKIIYKGEYQ